MDKLLPKIKQIPKTYFSFADIQKITQLKKKSLAVSLSRLVADKKIIKIQKGWYTTSNTKLDWENFAITTYAPSYLSFEWALARYNVLSQQTVHLTLATIKRSKTVELSSGVDIIYHHIQPSLFWGYLKEKNYLIADPEKAFLDLAYLSLNGYAHFDPEEMNLTMLKKQKIKQYLAKFKQPRLNKLVARSFFKA